MTKSEIVESFLFDTYYVTQEDIKKWLWAEVSLSDILTITDYRVLNSILERLK